MRKFIWALVLWSTVTFGYHPDPLAVRYGGTGAATKALGFDGLSPMTTGGDLIYGGASGTGTRLANGTAGQVLTSNGTTLAPSWKSPVAFSVNSPNNSISGSYTTLKYQTVTLDTNSAYSTSTGRFTVPVTGIYLVTGYLLVTGTITLSNQIDGYILKNNTTQLDPFNVDAGNGFANIGLAFTSLQSYTAGDTIEIQISTNVGSPTMGGGNLPYNHLSIQKL